MVAPRVPQQLHNINLTPHHRTTMAVSFIDLPVEVMIQIISYIDNVPTLHSMLSTKKVRHHLANHIKIVLDYPDKQPRMFPFDDFLEVMCKSSLADSKKSSSLLYIVEIDMAQPSFHSSTFYPASNGSYSELQKALSGYSGANCVLCLSVADPLSSWSEYDLQMFSLSPQFAHLFDTLEFRAIHVMYSGQLIRPLLFRYNSKLTFGEVLNDDVSEFLENGSGPSGLRNMSMRAPSRAVVEQCIKRRRCSIPSVAITTHPPKGLKKVIPGGILKVNEFTWRLQDFSFKNICHIHLGLIHTLDKVTVELSHETPPEVDFLRSLNIDDFKWQLELTMGSSNYYDANSTDPNQAPSICSLSSKTLSSLSIDSYSQIPQLSDIDLPNLTALSMMYHNKHGIADSFSLMNLDTFRCSKIQFLKVNDVKFLDKCCFAANLTRLVGLSFTSDQELERFRTMRFPQLQILKAESLQTPVTRAPNLTRLQWTCQGTAHIKYLPSAFPKLEELEICGMFWDCDWSKKVNGYSLPNLEVFTFHRLPPDSTIDKRSDSDITVPSDPHPEWARVEGVMPCLKTFSYWNDMGYAKDRSLSLCGLDSLNHIELADVRDLKVSDCSELISISDTCQKSVMRTVCLSSGLPKIQFVTYKADSKVHELHEDIKHPVFFKRVDQKGKLFYYVHERQVQASKAEPGSPMSESSGIVESEYESDVIVERRYTSVTRLIDEYGARVEGLKDWLTEKTEADGS